MFTIELVVCSSVKLDCIILSCVSNILAIYIHEKDIILETSLNIMHTSTKTAASKT